MKEGSVILHYGIINILFIDCLINAVYRPSSITTTIVVMDMIKSFFYFITIIYSYKLQWFLGILVGTICFVVGLLTTYNNYLIDEKVYTSLVNL
jgi:hypothetical protein